MDRAQEMRVAQALNEAIWLRDNVASLEKDGIIDAIIRIGKLGVFSSRQLSAITNGALPHTTVSKLITKTDKTGGKLNVGTLDILRTILISRADSSTDFNLIADAVGQGTSQGMVAKLTGVNQGTISKKMRQANELR